jgi:hypothetical protein
MLSFSLSLSLSLFAAEAKCLQKKLPAHIGRFAPEGVHDATKKKENPAAIA